MNNLQEPAYPCVDTGGDRSEVYLGFTKLEKAALMIAQGYSANSQPTYSNADYDKIARWAVGQAKAVLEEANK